MHMGWQRSKAECLEQNDTCLLVLLQKNHVLKEVVFTIYQIKFGFFQSKAGRDVRNVLDVTPGLGIQENWI